jgi:hypothetical protein
MARCDFWAYERHFIDHLAPIWHALADEHCGEFWTRPSLAYQARKYGIEPRVADGVPRSLMGGQGPVVTAAWGQARDMIKSGRPVVLLNHGSGQTFIGVSHPSYSGGAPERRRPIALFLEPGPHSAEATLRSLPAARVAQVGCAKLDDWHTAPVKPRGPRPTIAVSFHWRCKVAPETGTAFDYYRDALAELVDGPWDVLGHGHPAIWDELRPVYESLGIEPVVDFDKVLERADLYIADGTSTLYEFASTGRPVLCLNSPEYRRDVHHGLRFWDAVPGLQCDNPSDLVASIQLALDDPESAQKARAHGLARTYVACDGNAAQRAAEAIAELAVETSSQTVAVSGRGRTVEVSQHTWELLTDGVEIVDGRSFRMLVRRNDYLTRWGPEGWKLA